MGAPAFFMLESGTFPANVEHFPAATGLSVPARRDTAIAPAETAAAG
jgi:hypothetical protein